MENNTTFQGSHSEQYRDFYLNAKANAEGLVVKAIIPEVVTIMKDDSLHKGEKRCLIRVKFANPNDGETFEQTFWPNRRATAAEEGEFASRDIKDMIVRFGFWKEVNADGVEEWKVGAPKWVEASLDGKKFAPLSGEKIEFKEKVA